MSKTVAVYGATAFSAGPTIEYLLNHPDSSDFKLVLAGRNRQKLDKLKSSLSQNVEIAVLGLDDQEAVKSFAESADVIINLAGMSCRTTYMYDADGRKDRTASTAEKLSSEHALSLGPIMSIWRVKVIGSVTLLYRNTTTWRRPPELVSSPAAVSTRSLRKYS